MPLNREISNNDDVIDSRDVRKRLRELEDERSNYEVEWAEDRAQHFEEANPAEMWEADNPDEAEELKALNELWEELPSERNHGVTLIRESYFVEYCQELVRDIGDLPRDIPGYLVIDWDATADNLRADYSEVDYAGVTYLVLP